MRKNEFGTFLKNWVFHKNANASPWQNFRISKKFNLQENHVELDGYCNNNSYLWGAHVNPPLLAKREPFSKKNSFFQYFLEMKLSPKIGNLTPSQTEMLYFMFNNASYWGRMILGHLWKIEFFTKPPIPPPCRNFRISKKFK
jgi:hypothetical protein